MPGRAVLDTSAVASLLRGDPAIAEFVEYLDEVFTTSVVVGELLYGARVSSKAEANTARVAAFVSAVTVLGLDAATSMVYGRIKHALRAQGTPIPDNDLWIACSAIQHGLALAHRDAHFDHIAELEQAAW